MIVKLKSIAIISALFLSVSIQGAALEPQPIHDPALTIEWRSEALVIAESELGHFDNGAVEIKITTEDGATYYFLLFLNPGHSSETIAFLESADDDSIGLIAVPMSQQVFEQWIQPIHKLFRNYHPSINFVYSSDPQLQTQGDYFDFNEGGLGRIIAYFPNNGRTIAYACRLRGHLLHTLDDPHGGNPERFYDLRDESKYPVLQQLKYRLERLAKQYYSIIHFLLRISPGDGTLRETLTRLASRAKNLLSLYLQTSIGAAGQASSFTIEQQINDLRQLQDLVGILERLWRWAINSRDHIQENQDERRRQAEDDRERISELLPQQTIVNQSQRAEASGPFCSCSFGIPEVQGNSRQTFDQRVKKNKSKKKIRVCLNPL